MSAVYIPHQPLKPRNTHRNPLVDDDVSDSEETEAIFYAPDDEFEAFLQRCFAYNPHKDAYEPVSISHNDVSILLVSRSSMQSPGKRSRPISIRSASDLDLATNCVEIKRLSMRKRDSDKLIVSLAVPSAESIRSVPSGLLSPSKVAYAGNRAVVLSSVTERDEPTTDSEGDLYHHNKQQQLHNNTAVSADEDAVTVTTSAPPLTTTTTSAPPTLAPDALNASLDAQDDMEERVQPAIEVKAVTKTTTASPSATSAVVKKRATTPNSSAIKRTPSTSTKTTTTIAPGVTRSVSRSASINKTSTASTSNTSSSGAPMSRQTSQTLKTHPQTLWVQSLSSDSHDQQQPVLSTASPAKPGSAPANSAPKLTTGSARAVALAARQMATQRLQREQSLPSVPSTTSTASPVVKKVAPLTRSVSTAAPSATSTSTATRSRTPLNSSASTKLRTSTATAASGGAGVMKTPEKGVKKTVEKEFESY